MLFFEIIGFILLVLLAVMVISAIVGVPFLPTHRRQAELMMELANVGPSTKVVDLGSGAGRLLFLAARRGASAVGYELNPILYVWTKIVALCLGLSSRVSVRLKSLYQADLAAADVVVAFLLNQPMKKLAAKLFSELKPGAVIVSYAFPIPGHEPIIKKEGLFVYKV